MINTIDLATKIFNDLNNKGANLGNVSVFIIQKTLDKAFESKPVYSEKDLENAFEFGKGTRENIKEEKKQSFDNKVIQKTKKDLKFFLKTTDNEKLKYYVSVLKRKRLYNKYIDACLSFNNCFYFRDPEYRNNSLKDIKSWSVFIGGSFAWHSTKEKSIFWQNISNIKIRENVI